MTPKSIITIILSGALFLIIGIGSAYADNVVLEATKDTFTNEAYPDRNYGDINAVIISNAPISRLGFFDFRTWEPPVGVVIDSATFNFYIYDHSYSEDAWLRICAAVTVTDWDENEIKWSGPYPGAYSAAGSYAEERVDLSTGWKSIDVTNIAQLWLSGEIENRGLVIRYTEADDFRASIRTKEYGSEVAYLEVEYHSEIADMEFVPPFELVAPDSEVINISRPTFSWTPLDGLDVGELVLIVNLITDGGADSEEAIRDSVPVHETEYTTPTELEDGDYRWYMEAYWGGAPVYRTESYEFAVELIEAVTAAPVEEIVEVAADMDGEILGETDSDEGEVEVVKGRVVSLGNEQVEGIVIDYLVVALIFTVGTSVVILFGMFGISNTKQKTMASEASSTRSTIDVEHI